MKDAKVVGYSAYVNKRESPERMIDGNMDTKWCDVTDTPNYVDFDLSTSVPVSGWKLISAGRESHSYVTAACFLQGRNSLTEDWKTLDRIAGNHKNEVVRELSEPVSVRYIRLYITQPMQNPASSCARIYELEIYK